MEETHGQDHQGFFSLCSAISSIVIDHAKFAMSYGDLVLMSNHSVVCLAREE
jgi:hypothetical protein